MNSATRFFLFLLISISLWACRVEEPDQPTDAPATDPANPIEPADTSYVAGDTIRITWSGASAVVSGRNSLVTSEVSDGAVIIRSTAKDLCILAEGSGNGSLWLYSDHKYQLILRALTLNATDGPAICNQSHKSLLLRLEGPSAISDKAGYAAQNAAGEDQKACFFSEGQILMYGSGKLTIAANCRHGMASDDYVSISSGSLEITTTADAAKALKANDYIHLCETADVTVNQSGNKVVDGDDVSYCAALKADSVISIAGGKLSITSSAEGGRGLNADLGIIISGGTITAHMTGNGGMGSSGNNNRPGGGGGGGRPGGWGGGGSSTTDDTDSFTSPCIKTDGDVTISGGTLDFTTSGIKGFGIKAYGTITFTGGTFSVHTTGQGAEGIESKTAINLQGGHILSIAETEDAINCAGPITCSGAWVYAVSNGNDAIDSNYGKSGAITITDGVVVAISSAGSPEEGLDCDNNSYIKIQGGYVFTGGGSQGGGGGWGGSTSASVGSSTQGYCFTGSYALTKNNYYTVKNASGDVLLSIKALASLSSSKNSLSLISAPTLTKSGTNTIVSGTAEPTGDSIWSGYIYLGGTTSNTTSVKTFTGK